MRYSRDHKTGTRRRIVDAASRAFRRQGASGVSVSQIMAEAGLTVGGFYRHFGSKDELFREALEQAMGETLDLLQRTERGPELEGDEWLRLAAKIYLAPAHRDMHERGCPLPALTAEVGRRGDEARRSFAESLRTLADVIAARIDPEEPEAGRARALGFLSTLVGGLLLARGVGDDRLSREILDAGREAAVRGAAADGNRGG